jgi:hypothetical protein
MTAIHTTPDPIEVTVVLSGADAELIREFLKTTQGTLFSSHGPLDLTRLAGMLLEDVALMMRRPGSWEGSNMERVMFCHGYELDDFQHVPTLPAAR